MTGHFTSYENRTDHELATRQPDHLAHAAPQAADCAYSGQTGSTLMDLTGAVALNRREAAGIRVSGCADTTVTPASKARLAG